MQAIKLSEITTRRTAQMSSADWILKRIYFGQRDEEENEANDISRLAWCVPFGSQKEKMELSGMVTRWTMCEYFLKRLI